MKKPELLAPAGNIESFYAAIEAGADAIYLGGYQFGARSFASNFSNEEIVQVIKEAHLLGVKVYVTVNTLIYENEVETFLNYIDFLHKNQVDAVIIQDLGMMDLLRKTYPNLKIHASTQMHIHNLDGVKVCESLGLERVVLARETPIKMIEKIKQGCNIQLEIFAHGALCVSYSGQCLMSSLLGGRSGNRGTCTQCCRLPYDFYIDSKKVNKEKYLLSMKDLNTLENIGKFMELEVDSIKIEGRMKRPEYVYLVTSLYRKAIDSYYEYKKVEITKEDLKELEKIFNRTFTKGYLFNESPSNITNSYRPNHMGIPIGKVVGYSKGKVKIELTDSVSRQDGIRILGYNDVGFTLLNIFCNNKKVEKAEKGDIIETFCKEKVVLGSQVVKTTDFLQLEAIQEKMRSKRKVALIMNVKAFEQEKLQIKVSDGIHEIKIEGPFCEKALKTPITEENIKKQLSKLGDTVYVAEKISCEIKGSIFFSLKELNEVRRKIVERMNELRLGENRYQKCNYQINVPDFPKETQYHVSLLNEYYPKIKDLSWSQIYMSEKSVEDPRVSIKFDRVIKEYPKEKGSVMIAEVGGMNRYSSFDTDWGIPVTNSYTVAFLHSMGAKKVTLSYELTFEQIKELIESYQKRMHKNPNVELIVSSRIESMIMKMNLFQKYHSNKKEGVLVDQKNRHFPVVMRGENQVIYHDEPKRIKELSKYEQIGVTNFRYDLTFKDDVSYLLEQIKM